jgi:hypothetical protein
MQKGSIMRRIGTIATVGVLVVSLFAPSAAFANDSDVIKRGGCDGTTTWKLKLSKEDPNLLEVAFEVDQNVNDQAWRVRLRHNGELVFKGKRMTKAPSGSFTVRRTYTEAVGKDAVKARARNLATGEVCIGRVVLRG